MRRLFAVLLATALVAGCSDGASNTAENTAAPVSSQSIAPDASTTTAAMPTDPLADRPFDVFVPASYDEANPMPLLVLLHGYTASGDIQEAYFQFEPLAEERGFLYVHPDGTTNPVGAQFWNATEACCGFASTVDDSAYLEALIEKVQDDYNVDPRRIYFVGHSNGGFMSYRMACDLSDTVAAVASLAGATFIDPADCGADEPVSVVQIHGTADATIAYEGDSILGRAYPAATATAATWAELNGCTTDTEVTSNAFDLVVDLDGAETSRTTYTDCPDGIGVELWTITDGNHVPARTPDLATSIIDFLFAHPKP